MKLHISQMLILWTYLLCDVRHNEIIRYSVVSHFVIKKIQISKAYFVCNFVFVIVYNSDGWIIVYFCYLILLVVFEDILTPLTKPLLRFKIMMKYDITSPMKSAT